MAAVAAAAAAAAAAAVDARAAVAAVGARVQLLPAGDASPGLLGPPLLVLSRRCACVADDIDAAAQPRNSPPLHHRSMPRVELPPLTPFSACLRSLSTRAGAAGGRRP